MSVDEHLMLLYSNESVFCQYTSTCVMFFTGMPICVGIYTNNFDNFSCWMGQHPPCDARMESPDSTLFEGIGSSVPQLYHRKELTNVHAKWVVVLIFWWFLSSGFYGIELMASHYSLWSVILATLCST